MLDLCKKALDERQGINLANLELASRCPPVMPRMDTPANIDNADDKQNVQRS